MYIPMLLRTLRRRAVLSQRELAQRAGVPHSTVVRIESGKHNPRLCTLLSLVEAAGCRLVPCDADGEEVEMDEDAEQVLDRSGRHLPAHLEWGGRPDYMDLDHQWWGWLRIAFNICESARRPDPAVPNHIYWHRPRQRPAAAGQSRPSDGPPA